LRQICLEAGADDVGFVEIGRPGIGYERAAIERLLPGAKALVGLVRRMNRQNIRTPARSIANLEFEHAGDDLNQVARRIVAHCERQGVRAVSPAVGFPMEANRWPEKIWAVSHKLVAVEAGLGHMGIHRNVIHPRFGNFILLDTVIVDAEIDSYSRPLDYNPCLECKLCVAACPVGAISPDGYFNFSACYTHNYREFMGGFADWVDTIADSKNSRDYRSRVADSETVSIWQSLGFGPNYKAAYCLSVCPAGEDVIGPYLTDRKTFMRDVVRPLQEKKETIYVVPGSDAESHVPNRFPNKVTKRVSNGLRVSSIDGFLRGLHLTFQPNRSKGIDAVYHSTFTGDAEREATVVIRNQKLEVREGHSGTPDFRLAADSRAWLAFLRKETKLAWLLMRAKVRFRGNPKHLLAFSRCFPA
jgi:NAD-dependent dihydropyrimidine dehydrogenase PreA subunit